MTKADCAINVSSLLKSSIPELVLVPKGEMTYYSPSKNIRVQIVDKQKILPCDYTKFDRLADELRSSISLFVSCGCPIPFDVKSNPLRFYVTPEDLTPRFMEMLTNQKDASQSQKDIVSAIRDMKKRPVASRVNSYADDEEGFQLYCKETPVSKMEFEKARKKWKDTMDFYECLTRSQFRAYILSVRSQK